MPGGRIGRLKPDKMDAFNDCEVADDIVTDIINVNNENERLSDKKYQLQETLQKRLLQLPIQEQNTEPQLHLKYL